VPTRAILVLKFILVVVLYFSLAVNFYIYIIVVFFCIQNFIFYLVHRKPEGHSVERIYLRQRFSDG